METGRYVLASHDGFGLGHVRRNMRIAQAIRLIEPDAEITVVTGVASKHDWLDAPNVNVNVVRVPSLTKDRDGMYRNDALTTDAALKNRSRRFLQVVADVQPHVVLVDRHPFGLAGEWRAGLDYAKRHGAAIIVGLRDVLDEPAVVRTELAGDRWEGASEVLDDVLIYGDQLLCDHHHEYGLPFQPHYCGWVTDEATNPTPIDDGLLVVAAGGGGDGELVAEIGSGLVAHHAIRRAIFVVGPAGGSRVAPLSERMRAYDKTVEVRPVVNDCAPLFARAGVVVTMAGYNSTVEALSVGSRPILVPRRAPRREQAIRATRLASLGLADVVDADAPADEIAWLLDRPRRLQPDALDNVGLRFDGATTAARRIVAMVGVPA